MMCVMRRTQLILEEWQVQALKKLAGRQGSKSVSALVRKILSEHLPKASRPRKGPRSWEEGLGKVRGIIRGDGSEVDHDKILYDGGA